MAEAALRARRVASLVPDFRIMTSVRVRPLPPASLTRRMITGPAGDIETDLNDPGGTRPGIALIAHPNPVQGGTKDNKEIGRAHV